MIKKKKKTHAYLVEIVKIASVERVPLLAGCAIIALSLKKSAEKGKRGGREQMERGETNDNNMRKTN